MQRAIFEVYAKVVDANGSYNTLSGYPKVFDSRNYNNNVEKALQRAQGEFHETFGAVPPDPDPEPEVIEDEPEA